MTRTAAALCIAWAACAQSFSPPVAFEVASIKPATQADMQGVWGAVFPMLMRGGPGSPSPGEVTFKNASLKSIIMSAYDLRAFELSAPDWIGKAGFNIVAKVPPAATKEQIKPMLRQLLAERFQLVVHRESRDTPVYALVVGKGGAKLGPAKDPEGGGGSFGSWKGNARWIATNETGPNMASFLCLLMDRPVIDATGLTGTYDFTLYWAPEYPMVRIGPRTADAEAADPAPTIFAAVQDQLGLKLEPRRVPMDIVVVDSVLKRPTEN
jgi:uncharacterized protein (TIGR03435 family)